MGTPPARTPRARAFPFAHTRLVHGARRQRHEPISRQAARAPPVRVAPAPHARARTCAPACAHTHRPRHAMRGARRACALALLPAPGRPPIDPPWNFRGLTRQRFSSGHRSYRGAEPLPVTRMAPNALVSKSGLQGCGPTFGQTWAKSVRNRPSRGEHGRIVAPFWLTSAQSWSSFPQGLSDARKLTQSKAKFGLETHVADIKPTSVNASNSRQLLSKSSQTWPESNKHRSTSHSH